MTEDVANKLRVFFSQFRILTYKKGETILRGDDTPQGVYFIKDGYVRIYSVFEDGRELTLNIFKPGSYFSMMWAISNIPNTYFFQSMVMSQVQRAPREEVIEFIKKNPDVLFEFTQRILVGLDGLLTNVEHLLSGNAYQKIIATLFLSAKRFGQVTKQKRVLINIPLTHQDVANLAAMTRETASITLKKLERKGLISYRHQLITINSLEKLREESLITKGNADPTLAL